MDFKTKYEKLKGLVKDLYPHMSDYCKEKVDEYFPSIKKNDDERIRKAIFKALSKKDARDVLLANGIQVSDALAWLEKQGEQSKKVSIWKHWKDGIAGNGDNVPTYLIKNGSAYSISSCLGCECDYIKLSELDNLMVENQGEQKSADASTYKIGDFVHCTTNHGLEYTYIYERNHGDVIHAFAKYSHETSGLLSIDDTLFEPSIFTKRKATPEEICTLLQSISKHGYEWDAEDKVLKKIEQKPVGWSDEDEKMFRGSRCYLNEFGNWLSGKNEEKSLSVYKACDWLLSLKDRVQPQPKQDLNEDVTVNEYVDLGLPSGTLWKSVNEEGHYTFDEAIKKFSCQLPIKGQWKELVDECKWEWKGNGYDVIGPNGNMIYLPADGFHIDMGVDTGVYNVGTDGYYWSGTNDKEGYVWDMYFDRNRNTIGMYLGLCYYSRSVRLVD